MGSVVGLLTVLGVIGDGDSALVQAITGVVLIVGPAVAYIISRAYVKTTMDATAANLKIETLKAKLENPPAP